MDNPFDLNNKTIVVTGASSGLGKEAAILISKLGGSVILVARNKDKLNEVYESLDSSKNKTHAFYSFDLSRLEEIKNLAIQIIDDNGKIDGVINAAGIESTVPLKMLSINHLEEIFRINVFAGIELTKHLSSNRASNKNSSFIFMSSVMGDLGQKGKVAYCGTKGAVNAFLKPMALELAKGGRRVNCVSPGIVNTELTAKLFNNITADAKEKILNLHPLGFGEPSDVAFLLVYLLSDASRWMTGSNLTIDGGYSIE